MNIQELYQELIIDHGTQPRNCCLLANANGMAEGFNPLCGDKITVYLKIEHQQIVEASFTGKGCAISIASASLMTEALIGKTIAEVLILSSTFKELLTLDDPISISTDVNIGKLAALTGVKAFPARVKCATLAWHTLQAAISQESKLHSTPVTTECLEAIK
jgi:nitrogen fixation NifU-like protein